MFIWVVFWVVCCDASALTASVSRALTPKRDPRAEFDEADIRGLRDLVESAEKLGPDTKIDQALVRELKTRGREIVDAFDAYQAARDRAKEAAGLLELNRR